LRQPDNGIAKSTSEARRIAQRIGYPVIIRPSYVLGGRAMEIVHDETQLERYMGEAVVVSGKSPVLIDRYLSDAIEVDVDALSDGSHVVIAGVMEHIEEAGIHSGDSACSLPPHSLSPHLIAEIERQTTALALGLNVVGLMNTQYAVKNGDVYVLEVNPRASRTVPFVAKVIGRPIAKIAARVMAGEPLEGVQARAAGSQPRRGQGGGVPVCPLPRCRHGARTRNALHRRGHGDRSRFCHRVRQEPAWRRRRVPVTGTAFVSVRDGDKTRILPAVRTLIDIGFTIVATSGTQRFLAEHGLACAKVNKVLEGRPNIVDLIKNGDVQLVINTTEGAKALEDSKSLRRAALLAKVPYYTTLAGALVAAQAIAAYRAHSLEVRTLQDYHRSAPELRRAAS
jgi:carbamoyl-phosphate synthase large subunit